jgi:DNA-binding NtrC family response regulator
VILLTGAEAAPSIVENCGANAIVAKPFDIDALVETVQRHLAARFRP